MTSLFKLDAEGLSKTLVHDAEEEVFELYTARQEASTSSADFRGLGYVNSTQDTLDLSFDMTPVARRTDSSAKSKKVVNKTRESVVEVRLAQDKTALHSKKGDTGSVVWHASVDLARVLLQDLYSPSNVSLLNADALKEAHVLELGSGTGLLSLLLSSHVRKYTATDQEYMLPLIRKNIALNLDTTPSRPNNGKSKPAVNPIIVEALDWEELHSATPSIRTRLFSVDDDPPDLVLIVDCIYHPSLMPALVETMDHLTWSSSPSKPDRYPAVLVVVELRAEDAIRDFIELWLAKPGWEIWRIAGVLSPRYVVWLGQKTGSKLST